MPSLGVRSPCFEKSTKLLDHPIRWSLEALLCHKMNIDGAEKYKIISLLPNHTLLQFNSMIYFYYLFAFQLRCTISISDNKIKDKLETKALFLTFQNVSHILEGKVSC